MSLPREVKRIGLVLAGGGAKGAYQIGCLRALRRAGIDRFSAISGSSVGAIHAVLVATDKMDHAAAAWRLLRLRDIIRIVPRRIALVPTWMAAAFTSEFSPFSIWRFSDSAVHPIWWRRWAYCAACTASAALLGMLAGAIPRLGVVSVPLAVLLAACAVLIAFHRPLRRHYLERTLTSTEPLERTLSSAFADADCDRLRAAGIPVYATVSRFRPFAHEGLSWGGWVPQYLRVDQMGRRDLLDVLLCGCALPGFSGRTTSRGEVGIDGAWTDVLPLAPLLPHADDLDLIVVIYLKPRFRHRPRHNSLLGVVSALVDNARGRRHDSAADLVRWAEDRLQAAGGSAVRADGGGPKLVRVMPSRRVGNFFSGTMWFDRSRAERLAALGEDDMRDALAALSAESPEWAWISPPQPVGTRPDRTQGEYAPIPA